MSSRKNRDPHHEPDPESGLVACPAMASGKDDDCSDGMLGHYALGCVQTVVNPFSPPCQAVPWDNGCASFHLGVLPGGVRPHPWCDRPNPAGARSSQRQTGRALGLVVWCWFVRAGLRNGLG